jgi:hypothetical protein
MTFQDDFKEALAMLPDKEKDKLILRLLRKDLDLANKLYFKLVETRSVDSIRGDVLSQLENNLNRAIQNYYSPGYLLMDMRYASGDINEHVKVTGDKYGEISLNLFMLNRILGKLGKKALSEIPGKYYKFVIYIIARIFKLMILVKKMHEDLHIEFRDDFQLLGKHIANNDVLMKWCIYHGLNVNWLLQYDIPDDIALIHKDLKERGYLK